MTDLTPAFESERPRLRALAVRMLGDAAEADDVVQETWLRLERADTSDVENLPGWLTTVASRLCLDHLRRRTTRPAAPWSDDAAETWADPAPTPEDEAVLAAAVGSAMQVVLDSLNPAERLAYVLHDVFALPFDQVAPVLGRTEMATRQLASRARRRLAAPDSPDDSFAADREVVDAFLAASRENDFDRLLDLLDPEAAVRVDAVTATRPLAPPAVSGARAVAESFVGRARGVLPAVLDGRPVGVWQHRGEVVAVFAFTILDGRVAELELIAEPAVLARVER